MNSSEELDKLSSFSEIEDVKNGKTTGMNIINKIETEILDYKNKQDKQ